MRIFEQGGLEEFICVGFEYLCGYVDANKIDLKQIGRLEVLMKKMSPKISINWQ